MRHVVCALAIWLGGASFAVAQPFIFHGGSIGSGGNPRGIVAADFDGDGHLDFATANLGPSPHDVSVWHGDGHGGFDGPEFYAVGKGPFSIAAGDVNHDGHPDLAVAVADSFKVTILLWTPSGFVVSANIVFPTPSSSEVPAPASPREIAIVDFNRDGNARTRVHAGRGRGRSRNRVGRRRRRPLGSGFSVRCVGNGSQGLAVGDLNNDGFPDIIMTNSITGEAYVMFNAGSGTFGGEGDPAVTGIYKVGQGPRNVVIADFNHDRYPDFATINTDDGTVSNLFPESCSAGRWPPLR